MIPANAAPYDDARLLAVVRDVPDFPRPGIVFKDITPILLDPAAFRYSVERLREKLEAFDPEALIGIEARGFLFAAALAFRTGLPLVPVRKPGKLPWRSVRERYSLEYGTDALEMHEDALVAGARVVIVDDVLATGGTAAAVVRLVERVGAKVAGCAFVIELGFLAGRDKLAGRPVASLLSV